MSARFPKPPLSVGGSQPTLSPLLFRRQRFLMQMAAYRPLFILAGIWVGLMAIALLAYGQLLHTNTTQSAPSSEPMVTAAAPSPSPNPVAETSDPTPTAPSGRDRAPSADKMAAAPTAASLATKRNGVPLWTWAALVGTCALGCGVLSHRLKAPPRRKQVRKKSPRWPRATFPKEAFVARRPAHPKSLPPAPRRLDPYDPEQPLVANAPTSAAAPSPSALSSPAVETPEVTVLAQDQYHRLDWPEDSLVNRADVRQRRSLSSFL